MLDLVTCSTSIFKQVRQYKAIKLGALSDHSAVEMKFHLNSIAINIKEGRMDAGDIDYATIVSNEAANLTFNDKLRSLAPDDNPNYTDFFPMRQSCSESNGHQAQNKAPRLVLVLQNPSSTCD